MANKDRVEDAVVAVLDFIFGIVWTVWLIAFLVIPFIFMTLIAIKVLFSCMVAVVSIFI